MCQGSYRAGQRGRACIWGDPGLCRIHCSCVAVPAGGHDGFRTGGGPPSGRRVRSDMVSCSLPCTQSQPRAAQWQTKCPPVHAAVSLYDAGFLNAQVPVAQFSSAAAAALASKQSNLVGAHCCSAVSMLFILICMLCACICIKDTCPHLV